MKKILLSTVTAAVLFTSSAAAQQPSDWVEIKTLDETVGLMVKPSEEQAFLMSCGPSLGVGERQPPQISILWRTQVMTPHTYENGLGASIYLFGETHDQKFAATNLGVETSGPNVNRFVEEINGNYYDNVVATPEFMNFEQFSNSLAHVYGAIISGDVDYVWNAGPIPHQLLVKFQACVVGDL